MILRPDPPCFEITGDKHCWDAAEILQSRSTNDRTIYSWDPSTNTRLTLPTTPRARECAVQFQSPLGCNHEHRVAGQAGGDRYADPPQDLADWVRGNDAVTEAGFDFRDREKWMLGDIIYSTPVVVGTPSVGGGLDTRPQPG